MGIANTSEIFATINFTLDKFFLFGSKGKIAEYL